VIALTDDEFDSLAALGEQNARFCVRRYWLRWRVQHGASQTARQQSGKLCRSSGTPPSQEVLCCRRVRRFGELGERRIGRGSLCGPLQGVRNPPDPVATKRVQAQGFIERPPVSARLL